MSVAPDLPCRPAVCGCSTCGPPRKLISWPDVRNANHYGEDRSIVVRSRALPPQCDFLSDMSGELQQLRVVLIRDQRVSDASVYPGASIEIIDIDGPQSFTSSREAGVTVPIRTPSTRGASAYEKSSVENALSHAFVGRNRPDASGVFILEHAMGSCMDAASRTLTAMSGRSCGWIRRVCSRTPSVVESIQFRTDEGP